MDVSLNFATTLEDGSDTRPRVNLLCGCAVICCIGLIVRRQYCCNCRCNLIIECLLVATIFQNDSDETSPNYETQPPIGSAANPLVDAGFALTNPESIAESVVFRIAIRTTQ